MIAILIDKTITEFSNSISDTENPVPAGGSTIATTGLLGVSLLQLVIAVSNIDKPEYNTQLAELKDNLSTQIDQDVIAYQINQANNFTNEQDLKKLIEIPLAIAQSSDQALKIAKEIKANIKNNVRADYEIAQLNFKASINGALAIIKANYQFFPDNSKYIDQIKNQVQQLAD